MISFALVGLILTSCETKKEETVQSSVNLVSVNSQQDTIKKDSIVTTGDNSKTSVDWVGKYEGTLPCADCEGIKYIVELKKDGNFFIEQEYLGKETVYQDEGFYKWDASGNVLHLNSNVSPLVLKVEENRLKVLDQEGKEITGNLKDKYILKKIK